MSERPLDEAKRRIKVEQVVRDFFMILDQHHLTLEEGMVAWNMLGFTMFQEAYPEACLLYTSPSPRDATLSRMPSSA